MDHVEVRQICRELRAEPASDGKPARIVGYSAVYDSPSEDLGGFIEYVRPGAFRNALGPSADIRAKFNHNELLGRTKSGTARVSADKVGLRYEIDIPDTTVGRNLLILIQRGDVAGSSFAFRVRPNGERWSTTARGQKVRELLDVEVFDVGPVDEPAYLATEGLVGLRALPEASRRAAQAANRSYDSDLLFEATDRQLAAEIDQMKREVEQKYGMKFRKIHSTEPADPLELARLRQRHAEAMYRPRF